jgi:sulfoxide reductase heme-binding subunit YedZ
MRSFFRSFGRRRLLTHVVLAGLSAASIGLAHLYAPRAELAYLGSLGFGYASIALIAITLVIGPLHLLRRRRNPVNIDLRRDTGIWAGFTGCLHVYFALQLHAQGQVLFYFFQATEDGILRPLLNRFGLGNYIGAAATLLLVLLLLTSNTLSLRRLKGRRWKLLQRSNYILALLAILHTLIFQDNSHREPAFMDSLFVIGAVAVLLQLVGVFRYNQRRSQTTSA